MALLQPGSMMIFMVHSTTEGHMDAPVWAHLHPRAMLSLSPYNLSDYVATQGHGDIQAGTVTKDCVWVCSAGACVDFCGSHYHLEQLGSWSQLSGHWKTGPGPRQPPQWESCSLPQLPDPSGMAMGKLHRASMVLGELATSSFIV